MQKILTWDVYEIVTESTPINGVMLRGRIRKLGLEKGVNILAENAEDIDGGVRFATLWGEDLLWIIDYLKSIIKDIDITLVLENVSNPVLSKLKINKEDRYTL